MTIEFIRHGLTDGNAKGLYVGALDMPVNEEGLRQAAMGRVDPEAKTVFVTPLLRTQQTAAVLFPSARQVVLPEFREMNFGVFEGRTTEDLHQDEAFKVWSADGGLQPMEGGEGRIGFGLRVRDALQALIEELKAQPDTHHRMVCHGGVIMAVMMMHAAPRRPWQDWWVDNLTGHRVTVDPHTWGPEASFLTHTPINYGVQVG